MKKGSKKTKNVVTEMVNRPLSPPYNIEQEDRDFGNIEAFASSALNGLFVANAKDYDGSEAARKAVVKESWELATMMVIESLQRARAGTKDDRQLPLPLAQKES